MKTFRRLFTAAFADGSTTVFRIASGARALACLFLLALGMAGCVSKSHARAEARAAFLAGQEKALETIHQQPRPRGPSVAFMGPVKNSVIPWAVDLTLAKAIVAAGYYGATDPGEITIVRGGEQISVDPSQLLNGEDVPLQPQDVVEIRPQAGRR
jgi:hypothetical protein